MLKKVRISDALPNVPTFFIDNSPFENPYDFSQTMLYAVNTDSFSQYQCKQKFFYRVITKLETTKLPIKRQAIYPWLKYTGEKKKLNKLY